MWFCLEKTPHRNFRAQEQSDKAKKAYNNAIEQACKLRPIHAVSYHVARFTRDALNNKPKSREILEKAIKDAEAEIAPTEQTLLSPDSHPELKTLSNILKSW